MTFISLVSSACLPGAKPPMRALPKLCVGRRPKGHEPLRFIRPPLLVTEEQKHDHHRCANQMVVEVLREQTGPPQDQDERAAALRIAFILVSMARRSICSRSGRPQESRFGCRTGPPPPRREGGLFAVGQAAGLSLPGALHSAPFMNESFGVSARWLA